MANKMLKNVKKLTLIFYESIILKNEKAKPAVRQGRKVVGLFGIGFIAMVQDSRTAISKMVVRFFYCSP